MNKSWRISLVLETILTLSWLDSLCSSFLVLASPMQVLLNFLHEDGLHLSPTPPLPHQVTALWTLWTLGPSFLNLFPRARWKTNPLENRIGYHSDIRNFDLEGLSFTLEYAHEWLCWCFISCQVYLLDQLTWLRFLSLKVHLELKKNLLVNFNTAHIS